MTDFSGNWSTSFGAMRLEQRASKVSGTYRHGGTDGQIDGRVRGSLLRLRYSEGAQAGSGEFRLLRYGKFSGFYIPDGQKTRHPWEGHRGWDGLWETDFGRLRIIQERDRVLGSYTGAAGSELRGRASGGRLAFRYKEKNASGEGRFTLASDGAAFSGEWRPAGRGDFRPWNGYRAPAASGITWLVMLETHWQRSLAEPEYAFGHMLREILARLPQVRVRHRFFHDAASLAHRCHELRFLAEPVILMIASHGRAEGLSVNGGLINTSLVVDNLRHVENLKLLHFSSCLVGLDHERALGKTPFPISGYTTRVDWSASALLEFAYLDLLLNRGMPPPEAAVALPKLMPYAGARAPRGSPYPAAGFRFFAAR